MPAVLFVEGGEASNRSLAYQFLDGYFILYGMNDEVAVACRGRQKMANTDSFAFPDYQ